MIKRYMKLLIGLVAVAVIAIGAYIGVVVYKNNQTKKAYEEEQKKIIFSFDPLDITDMDVTNSTGDFSFRLTDNGWEITQGQKFPLSPDRFVEIATTMSTLTASKVLTEEVPEDLSEYGLDAPMKISFRLNDDTGYTAYIGSKVPGDSSYYLRAEGKDAIYIVSEEDVQKLSAEVSDLKDKLLFDTSGTSDITYLKYINNGTIVYDISKNENGWEVIAPFKRGVVNAASVTNITSLIIRAECVTFIDEELTDLSKFGFDHPSHQLEIKTDEKEAKIIFGNYYDEAGQYIYAYNRAIDQIYIFETASVGFIDSKLEDILFKRIHDEAFDNIKKFELDIFGTKVDIDYNYTVETGKTSSYSVNGKSVDRENEKILEAFNNLINSVTGVSFDYVSDENLSKGVTGDAAVKVVYRLKEGDDYKLEFIPKSDDESLLYIVENGIYTGTLIRKTVLENGMKLYYEELMELMK